MQFILFMMPIVMFLALMFLAHVRSDALIGIAQWWLSAAIDAAGSTAAGYQSLIYAGKSS